MDPLETHTMFFGSKQPVADSQKAFYANEVARGFSSKDRDPEKTDAALIRALSLVYDQATKSYNPTYLFFPVDQRPWVIERIHAIAKTIHSRMEPVLKTERGKLAIAHVRKWLEALSLGPVGAWKGSEPPKRWAAFGYTKDDNVPDWLKETLV